MIWLSVVVLWSKLVSYTYLENSFPHGKVRLGKCFSHTLLSDWVRKRKENRMWCGKYRKWIENQVEILLWCSSGARKLSIFSGGKAIKECLQWSENYNKLNPISINNKHTIKLQLFLLRKIQMQSETLQINYKSFVSLYFLSMTMVSDRKSISL